MVGGLLSPELLGHLQGWPELCPATQDIQAAIPKQALESHLAQCSPESRGLGSAPELHLEGCGDTRDSGTRDSCCQPRAPNSKI